MKKSDTVISGVLRVLLIQFLTSALLITFLHRVLIRDDHPELMLMVLLHTSPDQYSFDLIKEMLQFSLFVPVMMYISIKMIRPTDADFSYLMIRHQIRPVWFALRFLSALILFLVAALTTILTLWAYISIFVNKRMGWPIESFVLLSFSLALGLAFYVLLTLLITIDKPVISLMLVLMTLLSFGKLLVHTMPATAELTILSAIMLNHLFSTAERFVQVLKEPDKIVAMIEADLVVVGLLGFLLYQRIVRLDFIGRKS